MNKANRSRKAEVLKALFVLWLSFVFIWLYFNLWNWSWWDDAEWYLAWSFMSRYWRYSEVENTTLQWIVASWPWEIWNTRYKIDDWILSYRYIPGIIYVISFFSVLGDHIPINLVMLLLIILCYVITYLWICKIYERYTHRFFFHILVTIVFWNVGFHHLLVGAASSQTMKEMPIIFWLSICFYWCAQLITTKNKKQWIIVILISSLFLSLLKEVYIALFVLFWLFFVFKLAQKKKLTTFISLLVAVLWIVSIYFLINSDWLVRHWSWFNLNNFFHNTWSYRTGQWSFTVLSRFFEDPTKNIFFLFSLFCLRSKKYLIPLAIINYVSFFLHSIWPNPYDRYIIPNLYLYHVFVFIWLMESVKYIKFWWVAIASSILLFTIPLSSQNRLHNDFYSMKASGRAVSYEDSQTLINDLAPYVKWNNLLVIKDNSSHIPIWTIWYLTGGINVIDESQMSPEVFDLWYTIWWITDKEGAAHQKRIQLKNRPFYISTFLKKDTIR